MKKKIYKNLRIACCILCALILAVAIFIFVYCELIYGLITVLAAFLLFMLTIYFKHKQEDCEKTEAESQQSTQAKPEQDTKNSKNNQTNHK
jgi:fatty acid desaturase